MGLASFPQYDGEVFWRYYERLRNVIVQGGHNLEKWEIIQLIYEGLNDEYRATIESMCEGGFLSKTLEEGWAFLEWLAQETYEWEHAKNNGLLANSLSYCPYCHASNHNVNVCLYYYSSPNNVNCQPYTYNNRAYDHSHSLINNQYSGISSPPVISNPFNTSSNMLNYGVNPVEPQYSPNNYMDERQKSIENSIQELAKQIETLAEIMKSEQGGEVVSEIDQSYVNNESNSLPTPYSFDHLVEPTLDNEPRVYSNFNESCLMNHIEENCEIDQASLFVREDSLMNETLQTNTSIEVIQNDSSIVDKQTEDSYTEGIYTSCITLEINEDSTGNAIEEKRVEQNILVEPELEVLSNRDGGDLGEPCDSLTFKTDFEASACNLDYRDSISALNTDLAPAPWGLIIPLPNFCPFRYLIKPLKYCMFKTDCLELLQHKFISQQEHENKLQQRHNSGNNGYIGVQDDFKSSMPTYNPAVQINTHHYDNLMIIRRRQFHDHSNDSSKALDKLMRTLTVISMSVISCSYCHFSELYSQAFDKFLRALTTYVKCSMPSHCSAAQNYINQFDYLVMIQRTHFHGYHYDYPKAFDKLRRTLTIISIPILSCSYLHFSEFCAQAFDKLLRALMIYDFGY